MTTTTNPDATIVDAPPIPTLNPAGEVQLQAATDYLGDNARSHIVEMLLDRVRALVERARRSRVDG